MTTFKILCSVIFLSVFSLEFTNAFELTLNIDTSSAPNLTSWEPTLRAAIVAYYSQVSEYLSYPGFTPATTLNITFKADCERFVTSSNDVYHICAKDLQKHVPPPQSMLDFIVQTTTWSIMKYPPPPQAPDWLTQCLSAYCRWYRYTPTERPKKPESDSMSPGPKTTSSDGCAYFVNYINTAYVQSPASPDVVQKINKQMRTGNYQDSDWKTITGKTGVELWEEMQKQG